MSHSDDVTPGHAPTARGYITGYVAALVLTLIPFGAVYYDAMSQGVTLLVIATAAVTTLIIAGFRAWRSRTVPCDRPFERAVRM